MAVKVMVNIRPGFLLPLVIFAKVFVGSVAAVTMAAWIALWTVSVITLF